MDVPVATLEPASVKSAVCMACGLCCSGALFDYAPLDPDEEHLLARASFTRWEDKAGFALPCPLLEGRRCAGYDDRPRACARYRCEVLAGLDAGAITPDRALQLVHRGAELADQAMAASPTPGRTIAALRRAFRANADGWAEADDAGRAVLAPLRLALVALDRHLDTHFRQPHQRQLTWM